jgi:hypothetical protein
VHADIPDSRNLFRNTHDFQDILPLPLTMGCAHRLFFDGLTDRLQYRPALPFDLLACSGSDVVTKSVRCTRERKCFIIEVTMLQWRHETDS